MKASYEGVKLTLSTHHVCNEYIHGGTSNRSYTYSLHIKEEQTTSSNPIYINFRNITRSRRNYILKAKNMRNTISWRQYAIRFKKLSLKYVHQFVS